MSIRGCKLWWLCRTSKFRRWCTTIYHFSWRGLLPSSSVCRWRRMLNTVVLLVWYKKVGVSTSPSHCHFWVGDQEFAGIDNRSLPKALALCSMRKGSMVFLPQKHLPRIWLWYILEQWSPNCGLWSTCTTTCVPVVVMVKPYCFTLQLPLFAACLCTE